MCICLCFFVFFLYIFHVYLFIQRTRRCLARAYFFHLGKSTDKWCAKQKFVTFVETVRTLNLDTEPHFKPIHWVRCNVYVSLVPYAAHTLRYVNVTRVGFDCLKIKFIFGAELNIWHYEDEWSWFGTIWVKKWVIFRENV